MVYSSFHGDALGSRAWVMVCAGALGWGSTGVAATPTTFDLPANDLALDQPRVNLQVLDGLGSPIGPEWSQSWLLDSGATGVFIAGGNSLDLSDPEIEDSFTNAYEELIIEGPVSVVGSVGEKGVGGVQQVEVTDAWTVRVDSGYGDRPAVPGVQMLANGDADFGGFAGIAGMPFLLDRVVSLTMDHWEGGWDGSLDSFLMRTRFDTALPAASNPRGRVSLPVAYKSFPYAPEETVLPTAGPLPFIDGGFSHAGNVVESDILFDTGAQLSIISSGVATGLGLGGVDAGTGEFVPSVEHDFIAISGVSGTVFAPVLQFDGLTLPGDDDRALSFNGVTAIVLDIDPAIQAIIGSDFVTTGWVDEVFAEPGADPGLFDAVHMAFGPDTIPDGERAGSLVFDLNPAFIDPLGDLDGDGDVDVVDLDLFGTSLLSSGADLTGDLDGDGDVDVVDLDLFGTALLDAGASSETLDAFAALTSVPEPASGVVLAVFGVFIGRRRRPGAG